MTTSARALLFVLLGGCSSSSTNANDAGAAAAPDAGSSATCDAPGGTTCPPTSGNCKGIGTACTKGGGECRPASKQCDLDLDARGKGVCISILECEPGQHDCGAGATCCKTTSTSNVAVCLPNQCLPSDCSPES